MAVYGSVKQVRNGNLPAGGERGPGGGAANQAVKDHHAREVAAAVAAPGVHRAPPGRRA